ncbi:MAG: TolC family protein [Deltaproteobacteria bacterium]|nr:TolC family protein [Deltaproteobacteria bacterium]
MKKTLIILFLLFPSVSIVAHAEPGTSGPEMTLRQAVDYALVHSPDLKSACSEIKRREGVARTARAGLLPQVDVFGDFNHWGLDHVYPPGTPPQVMRFDDTVYTAGAELKLLVWDFGKTATELDAARERIAAAESSLDRRYQELIFNVTSLYLQTLTIYDLIDAAESTRKSLNVLLKQTRELVESGRTVRADTFKVSARLAQVESDIATLEAGGRTSVSRLAAAMGFEGEPPRLVYTLPENVPNFPSHGSEAELIQEAMAKRPDLLSQMHEVRAASGQERAARWSRWPRGEFRASAYEYASNTPGAIGSSNGAPDNAIGDWSVGVRITFPLFDAGLRSGQVGSAAAQHDIARAAEKKLKLEIEHEVRAALAELGSARVRVRAMLESVGQAEEALRDEQLKYESGRSAINFVLDAEAALMTSRSQLRQAQRSIVIASLLLDLSLGQIQPASVSRP